MASRNSSRSFVSKPKTVRLLSFSDLTRMGWRLAAGKGILGQEECGDGSFPPSGGMTGDKGDLVWDCSEKAWEGAAEV